MNLEKLHEYHVQLLARHFEHDMSFLPDDFGLVLKMVSDVIQPWEWVWDPFIKTELTPDMRNPHTSNTTSLIVALVVSNVSRDQLPHFNSENNWYGELLDRLRRGFISYEEAIITAITKLHWS